MGHRTKETQANILGVKPLKRICRSVQTPPWVFLDGVARRDKWRRERWRKPGAALSQSRQWRHRQVRLESMGNKTITLYTVLGASIYEVGAVYPKYEYK